MPDATIQDVARAAGVSAASVSNLLNGRIDRMRAETRRRIETVIAELGYRPNPIARQLKTGRTPTLGLVVPTVTNPFFAELAAAVESAAQTRGYHLLLCNALRDAAREGEFGEQLLALGIRGLITASAFRDPNLVPSLIARGLSIVHFDVSLSDMPPTRIDVVSIDNVAATYLATMHLADLGHRSIAYATGPITMPNRAARLRGYRDALRERGLGEGVVLPGPPFGPEVSDLAFGEIGRQAAILLSTLQPRPTAIVALNDLIAIGVLSGLSEIGLAVPRDVSVVGFNDVHLAALVNPSLTTVRQPFKDMAELAVTRLLERLAEPDRPSSEHVFAPELIMRASAASPRSTSSPATRAPVPP